jgi:hypothetical protein
MGLEVDFFIQKLHDYILMRKTKVVMNANPISILLSRWFVNENYAH